MELLLNFLLAAYLLAVIGLSIVIGFLKVKEGEYIIVGRPDFWQCFI